MKEVLEELKPMDPTNIYDCALDFKARVDEESDKINNEFTDRCIREAYDEEYQAQLKKELEEIKSKPLVIPMKYKVGWFLLIASVIAVKIIFLSN